MNSTRKRVAAELLKMARELTSFEFDTEDALKKYLHDHPGADRSHHSVKTKENKPTTTENPSTQKQEKPEQVPSPKKEAPVEEKKDTVVETEDILPKGGFLKEEESSLPKKTKQEVSDPDQLFKQAEETRELMFDWLDRGKGIDKAIGARTYDSSPDNEELDKPGPVVLIVHNKEREKSEKKVKKNYKGDWSELLDVVRASVAVDGIDDVPGVMDALRKSGMKLAKKPKDRFSEPTDVGYRDILLSVKYPNGHVGELQVHVKPVLKAKSIGHKYYENIRPFEEKAEAEGRTVMTPEEQKEIDHWNGLMKDVYGKAWDEVIKKKKAGGAKVENKEPGKVEASMVASQVSYYEYEDKPAMWVQGHFPQYLMKGEMAYTYDLFKFFTLVKTINKSKFDELMEEHRQEHMSDKSNK
jgi:hypothetical protein